MLKIKDKEVNIERLLSQIAVTEIIIFLACYGYKYFFDPTPAADLVTPKNATSTNVVFFGVLLFLVLVESNTNPKKSKIKSMVISLVLTLAIILTTYLFWIYIF